jgi:hypothetical protein
MQSAQRHTHAFLIVCTTIEPCIGQRACMTVLPLLCDQLAIDHPEQIIEPQRDHPLATILTERNNGRHTFRRFALRLPQPLRQLQPLLPLRLDVHEPTVTADRQGVPLPFQVPNAVTSRREDRRNLTLAR